MKAYYLATTMGGQYLLLEFITKKRVTMFEDSIHVYYACTEEEKVSTIMTELSVGIVCLVS